MFKTVDDITLGFTYRDVVSEFVGVCTTKTQCLTGCDRVGLESKAKEGKSEVLGVDVTCLEYVDDGVAKRFQDKAPDVVVGAPSTRMRR